ncbi:hypothetical protein REC12_24455 [Desulfosporosinus sp. PR]|uniref:hypothetical protein n=1 Tax=Candidatus Desulfosporosinus nitrosoreducens TaxID=3401928 RepID=UPI0027EAA1D4|nr:hypothetical protein [Desulfosporosinus sp. PR]MDQ7096749.1 hypothetical protein [Desulfosporosinus sp. PR]
MQTLVQGGMYQVLEVLEQQEGYRACLCIDVETNNHYRPLILNIYENYDDIRRFLPAFYTMKQEANSDFIDLLSGKHSITAVFQYYEGTNLKNYFQQVDKENFELRCTYAYLFLEACLSLDAMADFIAYSCLRPENIVVVAKLQKIEINYLIRPLEVAAKPFKRQRIAVILEDIFVKNRFVPDELWEYIDELKQNRDESIAGTFSGWKQIHNTLLETHRLLQKESWKSYLIRRLKSSLQKRLKRLYRRSGSPRSEKRKKNAPAK